MLHTFDCESPDHEGDRHCTYESDITTGYGIDADNRKNCYACCAKSDLRQMIDSGIFTGYLTPDANGRRKFGNWPGSLSFRCYSLHTSKHAAYGGYIQREDAWFIGPDGYTWHVACMGDMECCTARRCNSGKWFIGQKAGKPSRLFRCKFTPTEATHGHLFGLCSGPYTKLPHDVLFYHPTLVNDPHFALAS